MLSLDPKTARATWTAAILLLLMAVVYSIRGTLFLFAVALLFAYLIYPMVERIGSRFSGKSRAPALAITYLLVLGFLAAVASVIGTRVADEARRFAQHPPDVEGFLNRLRAAHPSLGPFVDAAHGHAREQLGEILSAAPRYGLRILAASSNLLDIIAVPVLSFFLIKDGAVLRDGFLCLFRAGASRGGVARTLDEIHEVLLQYMRSLLFLCCTVLIVFSTVLGVMGVPYALLLSVVAFFCEFVPLMGPVSAAALILTVSAMSGFPHLLLLAIFLGVFRLLQDYAISPRLMSRGVELHPIFVIFGVFAGAELGGVAGVFLSIPVLAMGRIAIKRLQENVR